ncbi:hypothetical protein [Roseivirga sp.]|uniref:Vgb family protein n=1 Tax=Roseivirga sp. TaxID=1964215 RepID=UPI003B8AC79B
MNKKLILFLLSFALLTSCNSKDDAQSVPDIIGPSDIQLFDINNRNDASDIRVFFFYRNPVVNVEQFRLILIPDGQQGAITIDDFLRDNNTAQIISAFSGETRLNFVGTISDYAGNQVRNGQSYAVGIAAIHNLDNAASEFTISEEIVLLEDKELRDLYIGNGQGNSVAIIDEVTGELIGNFINPFEGGLVELIDIIEKPDGDFLVTGIGNNTVKTFSRETGEYKGDFTKTYPLVTPTKTAIGPDGLLYVSQWLDGRNHVVRFNSSDGEFVDEYILNVSQGMGHAWDSQANYYLASFGSGRVLKFDSEGNELNVFGENILTAPVNIWVDEERDALFVVDWYDGAVRRFNLQSGDFEGDFISGLERVEGFLFGRNNALYLCDWQENTIKEYDLTSGEFRRLINVEGLSAPNSMVYGPNVDPQ